MPTSTPTLFPWFMEAAAGGVVGDLIQLTGILSVEIDEMPDVEIEQEIEVEVASGEIVVELETEIEIEVS